MIKSRKYRILIIWILISAIWCLPGMFGMHSIIIILASVIIIMQDDLLKRGIDLNNKTIDLLNEIQETMEKRKAK